MHIADRLAAQRQLVEIERCVGVGFIWKGGSDGFEKTTRGFKRDVAAGSAHQTIEIEPLRVEPHIEAHLVVPGELGGARTC